MKKVIIELDTHLPKDIIIGFLDDTLKRHFPVKSIEVEGEKINYGKKEEFDGGNRQWGDL